MSEKSQHETSGQRMIRTLKAHYSHGARMMRLLEEYKAERDKKARVEVTK